MNDTPTQAEAGEPKRYTVRFALHPEDTDPLEMDHEVVLATDYDAAIRERDEARRERDALQVKYDLEYRLSCARLRLWQDEDDRRVEALAALSQQTARAERLEAALDVAKRYLALYEASDHLVTSSPPPTT